MKTREELGLPWRMDDILIIDKDGNGVMDRGCKTFEEHERFIVKAVNHHHELVEALEVALFELKHSADRLQAVFQNTGSMGSERQYKDNDIAIGKIEKALEAIK
jgi:hypothetical protein